MGNAVIVFIFPEPQTDVELARRITAAKKAVERVEGMTVHMAVDDAAATIEFFLTHGELPVTEDIPEDEAEESNFVKHARRELALAGNDEDYNRALINAVREFAKYGHSGGSAAVGIHILNDLLQFKNLTPLTNNPDEWMQVVEDGRGKSNLWQSMRNSEAFSKDGGNTYSLLSERVDGADNITHVSEKHNA